LGEYALSDVPKLSGLLETALYVSDLEESRQFYQRIFGFECLLEDHRTRHLQARSVEVESRVRQAFGGISLYFRDPDGHSVEVATPGLWANY
jgi:catechol 2,3-dioxygenase-like lactoylglutathione lyase family enzyme